jgi:Zn-dependent protease with chaperone function
MTLLLAAVLLGALSVILVGPASTWLARASWVSRAPRSAVILWQSIGLSAIASGIGAGLAVAGYRYHAGFAAGLRDLVTGLFGGHPLQGLGVPNALGLTLAADLLIVLFACFGSVVAGTVRARARHRRLLNLLARQSSDYPGTDLLEDSRPVAYCLPGRRPRIVVSKGALELLSSPQAKAVIEHERGHAHEHHGLVMLPMGGVRKLFAWVPYARLAPGGIASLLEMSADDYSAKRNDPINLATALVRMATSEHVPTCAFGAAANAVPRRVHRLLQDGRTSKRTALCCAIGAGVIISAPLALMLLV